MKIRIVIMQIFALLVVNSTARATRFPATAEFELLEHLSGGMIGLAAINTHNNARILYRAQERFPVNCTSKVMAVGALLEKSERDHDLLARKLPLPATLPDGELLRKYQKTGISLEKLAQEILTGRNHTAINMLVKQLGGLEKVAEFSRKTGNSALLMKRWWPSEARWLWHELQDTSTPASMADNLYQLTLGSGLAKAQRGQLIQWMKENTSGENRIRAGVPFGWDVAEKTGTGFYHGTTNDIGVIWPPNAKPIVIAIFYKHPDKKAEKREDILARATKIVLRSFKLL